MTLSEPTSDLARANLLRMRSQYEEARQVCLSILKRMPGDFSAHVLLGDIFAEEGRLEEALEWYELGLDLRPDDVSAAQKRDQIRSRLEDRAAAATIQQLGLTPGKSRVRAVLAASAVFVAMVGVASYLAGRAGSTPSSPGTQPAIVIGPQGTSAPPIEQNAASPSEPALSKPWSGNEDEALLARIQKECEEGKLVRQAISIPTTKAAVLSVESEDEAAIGRLVQQIFAKLSDLDNLTIRVFRGTSLTRSFNQLRTPAPATPTQPKSEDVPASEPNTDPGESAGGEPTPSTPQPESSPN